MNPKKINWDFSNIDEFLDLGFSDDQLEILCDHNFYEKDKSYGLKQSPWLFWTTELYSFGKCYRHWLKWPHWLPIPLYGDHGADPDGALYEHEIKNKAKYHLCFYSARYNAIRKQNTCKIPIRVPHPWITYRRSMGFNQIKDPRGCLVFIPHSVPGIECNGLDINLQNFFDNLKRHFDANEIKLCIHMHDIKNKLHIQLRKYGFPIFTVGNTSSNLYVNRFYQLIRNFQAAASNNSGSQLYYCVELGLNYFLIGNEVDYININHSGMPKGKIVPSQIRINAIEKDNRYFREKIGSRQEVQNWINDVLGINQIERVSVKKIRRIMMVETIRLLPSVLYISIKYGLIRILPFKIRGIIKKAIKYRLESSS